MDFLNTDKTEAQEHMNEENMNERSREALKSGGTRI